MFQVKNSTEFATQPKILKKKHHNNQSKREFSQKKTMFSTLKLKVPKNMYRGCPTKFAGSTQDPKNKFGTQNKPIKTKIFTKKKIFLVLRVKKKQNSPQGPQKQLNNPS
jgi:hypothetical protein